MKTFQKKIISIFLTSIFLFQLCAYYPAKAEASNMDTIKTVLGLIEKALFPNWPLPLTTDEIFSLLNVIEICKNPDDSKLMDCAEAATADPKLGPMLESSAGKENIELGIKIYLDLKNSDYVQLMVDGGEPIACAAAQIFTGFDVCGALKELAAIAAAVGEAAEEAVSWLDELGSKVFGPTPHMDSAGYYANNWAPFVRSYVTQKLKTTINNDTALDPYLPYWVTATGNVTYSNTGLTSKKSVNQIFQDCLSYYKGFYDDNASDKCNASQNTFFTHTDLLFKQATYLTQFSLAFDGVLKGEQNIWTNKIEDFKNELVKKFPDQDVLNPKKPYSSWNHVDTFSLFSKSKIGKIESGTICTDSQQFECVDLPKASGSCCATMANEGFSNIVESNYQAAPLDTANKAVEKYKDVLQKQFDDLKTKETSYWQNKANDKNYNIKQSVVVNAYNKITALRTKCQSLKNYLNDNEKYWSLCYDSEPLVSCNEKLEKLSKENPDYSNKQAVEDVVNKYKDSLNACVTASEKVVNEWQRMDNLQQPFLDGWWNYYHTNYKGKMKSNSKGQKNGEIPKDDMIFSLKVNYSSCVSDHMMGLSKNELSASIGSISSFVNKSVSDLQIRPIKLAAQRGNQKFGKMPEMSVMPNIAEGFCKELGAQTANPDNKNQNTDDVVFGGSQNTDSVDPSKRNAGDLSNAKSVSVSSGCMPFDFKGNKNKQPDLFHLMCNDLNSYQKCFTSLGADQRASKAQCSTLNGSVTENYVFSICCDRSYQPTFVNVNLMSSGPGSISPNSTQTIEKGSVLKFKAMPIIGGKVNKVDGCGAHLISMQDYETQPIISDCMIHIEFLAANIGNAVPVVSPAQQQKNIMNGSSNLPGSTNPNPNMNPGRVQPTLRPKK